VWRLGGSLGSKLVSARFVISPELTLNQALSCGFIGSNTPIAEVPIIEPVELSE
jgi:hypothetical protein